MAPSPAEPLLDDPILRDVPVVAGWKVLGRVVLYGKLGQGGMGIVYLGRHYLLGVDMAVKVLKPSLVAEDPSFAKRFLREAQVAARVGHQNVVHLYDAQQQHGLHWLAMEFVDGETADARVRRKGPLPEAEALAILLGAASGLAEAHRNGFVHRDVKPDNLLIARDGRVKVTDLGLVRREAGEASQSLGSGIMGTPQYMAPEQWETADVTAAADVFALGASLWYFLVGTHAVEGTSLGAIARRIQDGLPSLRAARPDLRPEVVALFERCVAPTPAARFADARALVEALRSLAPTDERCLADPDAGSGDSQALATPPTRDVLEDIRTTIEAEAPRRSSARNQGEAATVPSPPRVDRAEAATSPPRRRRAGLLLAALGATGIALAGGIGGAAFALGPANIATELQLANLLGFVVGGLLLALGWATTGPRFGGLFGSLTLVAGQVVAFWIAGAESMSVVRDLVVTASAATCLYLHLGTLEEMDFPAARLSAVLGLVGFGGSLFSFAKQWELTPWLWGALAWCGIVGITLFGLLLAIASLARWRDS